MMIPTTSIDGVSIPVMRDGANLVSDMPLGAVASQVLEQGAAFEAAVEQFQRARAEIPVLVKDTSAPLAPTVAQERDLPAALPTGEHLETAGRQFPQAGATPVPADVGAAARTKLFNFRLLIDNFKEYAGANSVSELLKYVLEKTSFRERLSRPRNSHRKDPRREKGSNRLLHHGQKRKQQKPHIC